MRKSFAVAYNKKYFCNASVIKLLLYEFTVGQF